MKNSLIIPLLVSLFVIHCESDNAEDTCTPACEIWQTCVDNFCVLAEGYCDEDTDCNMEVGEVCDPQSHICADTSSRSFYLGFTTWPFDPNPDSVSELIERVTDPAYGDILALHYMDGIPWDYGHDAVYEPDVLGPFYPESIQRFITDRIAVTAPLSVIYLAVDPLNDIRNGIANKMVDLGGSLGNEPFADYSFGDARAQNAYTNFVLFTFYSIYEHYTTMGYPLPKIYFNFGSEASELIPAGIDEGDGG
ncbi:MAG: hypothetical protein JRF33_06830, partial [Deltaproteobacteria bacterium]|nr:hypothetical protein [Deltaproteobacteria bacterium]